MNLDELKSVETSTMKRLTLSALLISSLALGAMAQSGEPKAATPADVETLDSTVKALYDVISGPSGKQRNWDRFRSLFHPDAKLIPTGKNPQTGSVGARFLTPHDYITRTNDMFLRDGFFEEEISRHTDVFGNIAHVFTTYEARRKKEDPEPFLRGINSIQLLNDGKRWWILNVYWQAEDGELRIPAEYLRKK
jgi:hypothetical protein